MESTAHAATVLCMQGKGNGTGFHRRVLELPREWLIPLCLLRLSAVRFQYQIRLGYWLAFILATH